MKTLKKAQRFSKQVDSDEESAFISCPEYIAKHIASQVAAMGNFSKAVELCSCIGAMCIQIAPLVNQVIGIELDPERVKMAKNNSVLYGVSDKVSFVNGDVLDEKLLEKLSADIVFLDSGWSTRKMDRSSHVASIDDTKPSLRKMFELTKKYLSKNIVARVPSTFSMGELEKLEFCRIENIHINGVLMFKVAYFLEDLSESYEIDLNFA